MISRILSTHREAEAFHWIGAAVVSLWTTLPGQIQETIVERAMAMAEGDQDASDQITFYTDQRAQPGGAN